MKVSELKERLSKKENLVLIDVREKEEVEGNETIPGSKNVPMGKVFLEAAKGNLPKDQKIVTICKTGGRCEIIAKELRNKGYNIEHLEGGIEEWKKQE